MSIRMVECPRCGGWGGEPGSNFGDHGWHPCFACGEKGQVSEARYQAMTAEENPQEGLPGAYTREVGT